MNPLKNKVLLFNGGRLAGDGVGLEKDEVEIRVEDVKQLVH